MKYTKCFGFVRAPLCRATILHLCAATIFCTFVQTYMHSCAAVELCTVVHRCAGRAIRWVVHLCTEFVHSCADVRSSVDCMSERGLQERAVDANEFGVVYPVRRTI